MSELIRTIEQCDLCGRFRYPNDLIAYECWGCGEWAEQQIVALRAEVAALKDKLTAMHRRAQDAESAAMEKAGQTHGSLGRALANAGYNQQRERADSAEREVAALKRQHIERDEWASKAEAEIDALKAELEKCTRQRNDAEEGVFLLMDECERLKAELAKYTGTLTDEQAQALYEAGDWPISARGWKTIDAAIRRVRGEG